MYHVVFLSVHTAMLKWIISIFVNGSNQFTLNDVEMVTQDNVCNIVFNMQNLASLVVAMHCKFTF